MAKKTKKKKEDKKTTENKWQTSKKISLLLSLGVNGSSEFIYILAEVKIKTLPLVIVHSLLSCVFILSSDKGHAHTCA